jgi:hypothetical protein
MAIVKNILCQLLIVLACGWVAVGQQYPRWFLRPGETECKNIMAGYANASFYPDSSAAQAFRNACEIYARHARSRIFGGSAFWSTERGTYYMGANVREEFDSTVASSATSLLKPLDTLYLKGFVVVAAGSAECQLNVSDRTLESVRGSLPPRWTIFPPSNDTHYYAVGLAPEYFYESSSWSEAERLARRNLARGVYVDIKSLQKVSTEAQEIRNEELDVTLKNVEIVARWRDIENKIFYSLVRMAKR